MQVSTGRSWPKFVHISVFSDLSSVIQVGRFRTLRDLGLCKTQRGMDTWGPGRV